MVVGIPLLLFELFFYLQTEIFYLQLLFLYAYDVVVSNDSVRKCLSKMLPPSLKHEPQA